jgi:hypothetical protein
MLQIAFNKMIPAIWKSPPQPARRVPNALKNKETGARGGRYWSSIVDGAGWPLFKGAKKL